MKEQVPLQWEAGTSREWFASPVLDTVLGQGALASDWVHLSLLSVKGPTLLLGRRIAPCTALLTDSPESTDCAV